MPGRHGLNAVAASASGGVCTPVLPPTLPGWLTPIADVRRLLGLPSCLPALPPQDPKAGGDGMAPLYGMAAVVPDRRIVGQFLVAYQDALLEAM